MDFRKQIVEDFAIVFDGVSTENNPLDIASGFQEKWGWFGVMYRLTGGDIIKLTAVTKLSLKECLTWLCYESDLQETQNTTTNLETEL